MELVRGVLVVREPAGGEHGRVTMRLARRLADHVESRALGVVFAAETGFKLAADPDTVRGLDVAFVRSERLPHPSPAGYAPFAPDLVVEMLSPTDRPGDVLAKVADWLTAGTALVWVVDSERRLALVYRRDGSVAVVAESGTLDGEDVVPAFSCPLATIL